MSGFRARIGLLIPSPNVTTEAELYAIAPPRVTFHFGRLEHRRDLGLKKYENMLKDLAKEVEKLGHAGVKAIGFACTTGSLYGGKGYNEWIEKQIRDVAHVPVTTTSSAVLEALRCLQVKRISVVTPYPPEVNKLEKNFLEANGYDVLSISTLNTHGFTYCNIDEDQLFGQVMELGDDESDAIFVSCTNLPAITVLERLEAALEKPVISSNQVTFWKLKAMVGLTDPVDGFGSLLKGNDAAILKKRK